MKKILIALCFFPMVVAASGIQPFFSQKIMSACDMSTTSCSSTGLQLNQYTMASVQMVYSGSPNGTIKMQVSNDKVAVCNTTNPACNVSNWIDYTPTISTIAAAGSLLWNVHDMGYQWARVVYTKSSGTGTLNVTFMAKGL